MSAYTLDAGLGLARVIFWAAIVFLCVPLLVARAGAGADVGARGRAGRRGDRVVQGAVAAILLVHVLVALHLFDLFGLLAGTVACAVLYVWRAGGRRPGAALQTAWQALVVATLDALDREVRLAREAGGAWASFRRRVASGTARGARLGWLVLGVVLLATAAWLRLHDALVHPAATQADHFLELRRLNDLMGEDRLWRDGFFPEGGTSILAVLGQVTAVDHTLLVRLAPGLAASALVGCVLWALRRLGAGPAGVLGGTALYGLFAFAGWLPYPWPLTGDVLAVELGLLFLLPALIAAVEAAGGDRAAGLMAGFAVAGAALVHPVVGALTLGAALTVAAVSAVSGGRSGRRSARRLAAAAALGAVVAALPAVAAYVLGEALPGRLVHGGFLRPGGFPVPPMTLPTGSAAALVAVGVLLVLLPSRQGGPPAAARRGVGLFLLALLALVVPGRLGVGDLVPPAHAGRAASLVGAVAVGLMIDLLLRHARRLPGVGQLRRRPAAGVALTAVGLAALVFVALPLRARPAPRLQPDSVVDALYAVKRGFPDRTWTVVTQPAAIVQVKDSGYFFPAARFPLTYSPRRWRFDPFRPQLQLPTRHVFIFVRDRDDPVLSRWVREYERRHADWTIFRREPGLTVVHLDRPPALERRLRKGAERRRRLNEPQRSSAFG